MKATYLLPFLSLEHHVLVSLTRKSELLKWDFTFSDIVTVQVETVGSNHHRR